MVANTIELFREKEDQINETLEVFGVNGWVSEIFPGPVVTKYGVMLSKGVGVRKIVNLKDDLQTALATKSIHIIPPMPGTRLVGIEIANDEKLVVDLRQTMKTSRAYHKSDAKLKLALGAVSAREPVVIDLTEAPHMLIAGTTGSGKSVCINSIVCNLLIEHSPSKLKLAMVDPKRVELTGYNGIPHLLKPVVTETEDAVELLAELVDEMENRYKRLEAAKVKKIDDYNSRFRRKQMPYIVLIVDELADIMLSEHGGVIKGHITRIVQKARAVGIHCILATQRPTVDVCVGLIKANAPTRLSFKVSSGIDSRVILDENGAEDLLGQGDAKLKLPDSSNIIRFQGSFISDREIEAVVKVMKERYGR